MLLIPKRRIWGDRQLDILQEIWNWDQQAGGVLPLLPSESTQAPPDRSYLVVDENAIANGYQGGPAHVSTLFPNLAWRNGQPPVTYQLFDELVKEAYEYSYAPSPEGYQTYSGYVCSFMDLVTQSDVLFFARKELCRKRYRNRVHRNLTDDNEWRAFLLAFWFFADNCNAITMPMEQGPAPTVEQLIDQFRDPAGSQLQTAGIIDLLVASAPPPDAFSTMETGGDTVPAVRVLLTETAADKVRDNLFGQLTTKSCPPEHQAFIRLLMQLTNDLILLWWLNGGGRESPFSHVFLGEASTSSGNLGGYHFWYKLYCDGVQDQPRGGFESEGLRYESGLETRGVGIPEIVQLHLSMQLHDIDGEGTPLVLKKVECGFLNGCSPEGLLALCLMGFYLDRQDRHMQFRGEKIQLEIIERQGTLVTAYPVLIP